MRTAHVQSLRNNLFIIIYIYIIGIQTPIQPSHLFVFLYATLGRDLLNWLTRYWPTSSIILHNKGTLTFKADRSFWPQNVTTFLKTVVIFTYHWLSERYIMKSRPQVCNFIKKETLAQVFLVNFVKFLITPFFIEHLGWLLLIGDTCAKNKKPALLKWWSRIYREVNHLSF